MTSEEINDLKKLEGKKVFLTPTGNNVRGAGSRVEIVTLSKVARVFIYFRFEGWNGDEKYRIGCKDRSDNGIDIDCGHNSGYIMYESMEDIWNKRESMSLSRKISDTYRFQHDYAKLDLEILKKVAKLLEVE